MTADDHDDFPEDGPLDPSVFDGLFDDLVSDDRQAEVDDNPLDDFLTVTLTGDIDIETIEHLSTDGERLDAGPEPDGLVPATDGGSEPTDGPRPPAMPSRAGVERDDGPDATSPDGGDRGGDAIVDDDLDDLLVDLLVDESDGDEAVEAVDADGSEEARSNEPASDETPLDRPLLEETSSDEPVFDEAGSDGSVVEDAAASEPVLDDDLLDGAAFDDDRSDEALFDQRQEDVAPFDDGPSDHPDLDGQVEQEPIASERSPDVETRFDGPTETTPPGSSHATEEGPVRASPPIQHDPRPEPEITPAPLVDDDDIAPVTVEDRPNRSRRLLAALAVAIVIGGGIGVGGALLLSQLIDGDQSSPGTASAAGGSDGTESAAATDPLGPDAAGGAVTGLAMASLRFGPEPGATTITTSPALELLATIIERDPTQPIAASVRTFTEPTAAEDLALSRRQAQALTASLVELGADPERVAVTGLGRSLLSSAQPVPNFVVPSAGLEPSELADVAAAIGPFAIGLDRATGQLRAESIAALDALAAALATDGEDRRLTLAAYSFAEPDRAANEFQARAAVEAAVARLTDAGVDPARLTTIVAGDEPFAVPDRVANHIDLRWGDAAAGPLAAAALAIDEIDFEPGTSELDPADAATIDRLGAVLVELDAEAVIDVHSFDGDEVQTRVDLSVVRAQAIGQRLLAAGVAADRLRLHGGTSSQFRGEGRVCRVVVTLLQPPDRS